MASSRRLRQVGGVGLVLLVVFGVVMGILWAWQRQLIYLPDTTPVGPAEDALDGARDVRLRTSDGLELGAWFVPAHSDPAQGDAATPMAVLVAPGNGGNREGRTGLARELRARGCC